MKWRALGVLAGAALGLVLAVGLAGPAGAHGGTVRVDDDYGPYHIIVATGPAPKIGDLLMTVIVNTKRGDNFDTPPVLGAAVTATFALTDSTTALPVSYRIPTEPTLGASGYYERVVTIPSDGNWQVTVAVSAPLGTASAVFPVLKRSPPVPTEWITWATIAVPVLVVILVFVYLWRAQRAAGPRAE